MIDRICMVCGEYVESVWTLRVHDEKEHYDISGHRRCIDELEKKVKLIKDIHKMPVDKVLKKIKFERK